MIKKQFQYAIDWVCQLDATILGDTYESIQWKNKIMYSEDELINIYNKKKYEHIVWKEMISFRNMLLLDSDWTQTRDVILLNDNEWKLYRQILRDITENYDPIIEEVIWPIKPKVKAKFPKPE